MKPPHLLGVGLLQEGGPERGTVFGVDKDQFTVDGGQAIVDQDLLPFSVPPDPEPEKFLGPPKEY